MSASLPTLILPPKPPRRLRPQEAEHRGAERRRGRAPIAVRMPRLRNCRRVTPSSSGSTGIARRPASPAAAGTSASPPRALESRRPLDLAARSARRRSARRRRGRARRSRPAVSRDERRRWRAPASRPARAATSSTTTATSDDDDRDDDDEDDDGHRSCSYSSKKMPSFHGNDEVEARAPEERADDDEHRPEHQEHREDRDRELAVLGLVATGSCRCTAP